MAGGGKDFTGMMHDINLPGYGILHELNTSPGYLMAHNGVLRARDRIAGIVCGLAMEQIGV